MPSVLEPKVQFYTNLAVVYDGTIQQHDGPQSITRLYKLQFIAQNERRTLQDIIDID